MEQKKMLNGTPWKLIFFFSLPLMLGNVFQQIYTVVDTAVVGQTLGVSALAAMGASDWISWMGFSIVTGFPQGFSILIAQAFGANDQKEVNRNCVALVQCSIVVAILFVILGIFVVKPMLALLHTPSDIIDMSYSYLRIIYLGIPITMLYNALASVLRALSDSATPLKAMIVASLVNVVLDFGLIVGLHGGIEAAAIATLIAQSVAALYCFIVIRKHPIWDDSLSFRIIEPKRNYEMFRIGLPMALQNLLIAIGGMVLTRVVNGYGTLFIAGFTAVNKLYGVLEIAAVSYGYAMITYVGQNYGAKQIKRIEDGVKSAAVLGTITAFAITFFLLLFGKQLLSIFISGTPQEVEQVLKVAWNFLCPMAICLVILYWLHIYRSTLQGLSNTIIPMVSGLIELALRILGALLLPLLFQSSGLYLVEPIAWIGAAILLIGWYWKSIKELKQQE
ncbi:MAG: MATE family efflux transporter [Erysipelotrichaceae bacterium]|nr:MATE family efflux transporter [Erysipelotrichaceae bacterium]